MRARAGAAGPGGPRTQKCFDRLGKGQIYWVSNQIIINGSNIDDIIKSSLDETSDLFIISILPTIGLDISFGFDQSVTGKGFQNTAYDDSFEYDIDFHIANRDHTSTIIETINIQAIRQETTPLDTYTFSNLIEGNFYNISASLTNNLTGNSILNIPVASDIIAIEAENFNINITPRADELNNNITFTFNQSAISSGFDVDNTFGHTYDIVFNIIQNSDQNIVFNNNTVTGVTKGVTPTTTYT